MILRDYQQDLFDRIQDALRRRVKRPLVVSPTGSGKTALFCYIANRAHIAGSNTIILVHRRELISQTSATLKKFGVPHGIIQPGITPDPGKPIQLAMVQTIARRLGRVATPRLIIIDECHHAPAGQYQAVTTAFPSAVVLGFTATPLRLDGKGLDSNFDEIILGQSVEWLMQQGFLCRPKYYAPPVKASFKGVKKRGGDYNTGDLATAMTSAGITGDAVGHYQRIAPNSKAVTFCCNITHAEQVMEQFNGAGIPSGIIKGDMSSHERKQIIDNLTSGKIMNMVSVDVVSEGFDLPSVETGILLRKTQSLSLCLQQIGRILRPSEGKTAVILDHVGNLKTHGLAEDEREWTLEGITKKTKKTESGTHTQCEDCYCMFDKLEPACPECGWVKPKPTAKDFEHSDEDLEEIRRKPLQILLRDVKTREELFVIAKIRKYHHGWVNHIARELKIL